MQQKHSMLRIFSIITSIGAYIMLIIGAIVSKTESGKGCGNSWPFCHGQLIPESLPLETIIEYSHRIVSSGVGLLILILTVWSWRAYRENYRVKLLGFLSLFFVVFQGALGALTVVFEGDFAKKTSLAFHFGFSLISFASVVLLSIQLFQLKKGTALENGQKLESFIGLSKRMHQSIWALAAYSYVVIYTGALVRHADATMGCGYQFPGCGAIMFPNISSIAGIHMLHRYAAFSIWILCLIFLIVVIRHHKNRTKLVKGAWWAFILISLQAVSGVVTILTDGVLVSALAHTTIISIFFTVLAYLCLQIGWKHQEPEKQ
ncbi:COX15/CtaA family protein [Hazenella coriacea]|uniref:Cytochrome c oxidase assembly protein subunit 15 n=1 Tax=Hazenella coriacea TaxID=1179467 RepID=A0A4R3L3G5_9BACL|nr:heme A synthase [Hazenella coriacea]TCS93455.1 cytochrome c oxidase assembly protein subunit 15 [Hazenella coriacea]